MKTLYLMCGIPGSGKSTWIEWNKRENDVVVSRDRIRELMVKGNKDKYFSQEKKVFEIYVADAVSALWDPEVGDVYLDATHVNEASRRKILKHLVPHKHKFNLKVIAFMPELATCLERNAERTGFDRVPDEAIIDMADRWESPSYKEFEALGFDCVSIHHIFV